MENNNTPKTAADALRRKGTFPTHTKLMDALDEREALGLAEYGEPLTPESTVNGQPITALVAATEARGEILDGLLYAMVVGMMSEDAIVTAEIDNAVRQGIYALCALQRAIDAIPVGVSHAKD